MGITKQFTTVLSFALTTLLSFSTLASAMYTTYQAKIIKPDGTPLESTNVNFRFTILDPLGACILYAENFNTINMAGTGGLVYFSLGSGIKTFPTSGTVNFSDVFNNYSSPLSCAAGGPPAYTPAAHDLRKIVMQFHDGNGWQTLPAMAINHVPYAMYAKNAASATTAVNSTQLNGKTDVDFVQVTSIPTCSASQALQFNGASFGCVPVGGGGGGGTVVSVSGSAPIMVSGSASAPVISINVASLSSDGYLTALDYAEFKAKLSASSTQITNTLGYAPVSGAAVVSQIAAANLSGDVSGTVAANSVVSVGGKTASQISASVDETLAATASATADTIVKRNASGNAMFNGISASTASLNYVDIYKPSSSFNIRLQAPTSLSTNYVLNLPTTSGTAGQVLSTDGAGNLSWINAATGSVTTVSGTIGEITSSGGATPTLGLADVGTAGTYYKVITDNKGRVTSGVTTLMLSDLPNTLLNTTSIPTCSGSQYLTFNGTSFSCVTDAGASGTITTLSVTGPISSTGGSNPTLSIAQANSTTNGYLSSADWNTFNNKQNATSAAIIATLGYTPANASSATQWITNGPDIYYSAGYVGVGNANPSAAVDVVQAGTSSYTGLKSNISSTTGNATGVDTYANGSNYSTGVLVEAQSNGAAVGVDIYAGVNSVSGSYVRGISVGIDDDMVAGSGLRLFASTVTTKASKAIEISSGFNSGYAIYANTNGKSYFKGSIGVGTTTPVTKLDVSGAIRISMDVASCAASYAGALRYNAGAVQFCDGVTWSSFGVAGSGITGLNGSTSGTQSFAMGVAGNSPAFNTANGVHTLNIPLASATGSVTAGLISNADYVNFSNKITSSAASIAQVLGYIPASSTALGNYLVKTNNLSDLTSSATARANLGLGTFATASTLDLGSTSATGILAAARLPAHSGDVTSVSGSAVLTLANSGVSAATYTKVTVNAKGLVTSGSQLTNADITTALGYTPAVSGAVVNSQVRVATNSGTVLTGTQTIDGIAVVAGDRVLVKNGSAFESGVYIVSSGAWTRAADMDTWSELDGYEVMVMEGSQAGLKFTANANPSGTMGSTAIYFNALGTSRQGDNIVLGLSALGGSTSSISDNVAIGAWSMYGATGTWSSVAVGNYSLQELTTGSQNTALGVQAATDTTTGARNTALGNEALKNNITGSDNTAVGKNALSNNRGKSESTAVGYLAMYNADNTVSSAITYNTALGAYALYGSATAANNTGTRNTALGHSALNGMRQGSGNIGVGHSAGSAITTGSNNVVIGSTSASTIATSSNNILLADGAGNERLRINSSGYVGIGTTTPVTALQVSGGVRISMETATCAVSYAGTLRYNSGNVEFCNGTSWSPFGVAGSGITSFNGSTSSTQTLVYGNAGVTPGFNTTNGVHTFNIPLAASASVTAGLLSNADYTTLMNKVSMTTLSNYLVKANNLSDLTSSATARTNLGLGTFATASTIDLSTASATGILALARLPSFAGDVTSVSGSNSLTVDGLQGRSVLSTAPTSGQVLAYNGSAWAPASIGSSQWNTSGTTINYTAGNIGVGTVNPLNLFHIHASAGNTVFRMSSAGTGATASDGFVIQQTATDVNFQNMEVGSLTFQTVSTERMRITSSGLVGIGTATPVTALDIVGDIQYTGTITDVSDRRLKTNIEPLGSALATVRKIKTYSYIMKDDPKARTEFGVMAQDMLGIIPQLVKTINTQGDYYGVNYMGLIPWSIRAIQEVDAETQNLKRELASLKEHNKVLEQKLEKILQALEQQKNHGEQK